MSKIKIIVAAIGAAILFILGILTGRAGRHNDSRINDAIDREGKFQDRIDIVKSGESEHQSGIADLENRVASAGAGISNLEDRIADTDGLAERLKKRNNLD